MAMRRALGAAVALFLVALAWVAVWVPFHATDALIYGRWSRLIGLQGGIHFDGIGAGYLQRPLVYVVQGWLWKAFGFHEWIGRLWSLLFVVVLVWAVWRIAARDRGGATVGAIAAVLLVATPDVVSLGAAGLTDVPVAAMVALTGVLVLLPDGRWSRWLLFAAIVAAAALAGLAKVSAFFALLGLGLALFVGPRDALLLRLVWRGIPLAIGALVALAWNAIEAHHIGSHLSDFLRGTDTAPSGGVVAYYAQLNAQSRGSFIAGMEWIGPYLTLPLLFGLIYGVIRVIGQPHRRSATIAAPAALVLSFLLPALASPGTNGAVGPWDLNRPIAVVGTLLLVVPLWWSRDCPDEEAPTRGHLAQMLVWAAPPTVAWIASAPFQTRYLSPGWAPLYALIAASLWTALRGTMRARGPRWGWAVVAVLILIAVVDLRNLDGLGSRPDGSISAARAIGDLGVSGWFHPAEARRAADPSLGALVDDTTAAVAGDPRRLITNDGRLPFYWPLRTSRAEPQHCADLQGYGTLVVAQSATGLSKQREQQLDRRQLDEATGGVAADPTFWARCHDPATQRLADRPGEFTVFRIET
jgi:4-amino-4-deoxy-L-arabinose transferase-like glycosyltransferase